MTERRQDLIRTLHAKLDQWNTKIDELEVQAKLMEAEARKQQEQRLEEIRQRRDDVQRRIEALGRAGEDARQDLEQGVNLAADALKEAIHSASSRFR